MRENNFRACTCFYLDKIVIVKMVNEIKISIWGEEVSLFLHVTIRIIRYFYRSCQEYLHHISRQEQDNKNLVLSLFP